MIKEIRRKQKETLEECLLRSMNIIIDGFFEESFRDVEIKQINVDVEEGKVSDVKISYSLLSETTKGKNLC